MKKWLLVPIFAALSVGLGAAGGNGCSSGAPSSDQVVAQQEEAQLAQSVRAVPTPSTPNWTEKRLVKDLYELRDDPKLATWAYVQGIDGRFTCLGRTVGYGIPYAVQFSNPQHMVPTYARDGTLIGYQSMPQAEPNGLFMPDNAEGTWLMMIDPATKQVSPVYIEPRVTVSQFRLSGPAVAHDCEG